MTKDEEIESLKADVDGAMELVRIYFEIAKPYLGETQIRQFLDSKYWTRLTERNEALMRVAELETKLGLKREQ